MVTNNHYIELYINNEAMELESQESLNLRINDVIFNPTKTTTTQATYSFSFDLPSTPNNDRILGYANNLSKANKFHARYPSQVYADGTMIFDGSLTVQKYNAAKKMYTCNLVNIKVNTLEELFGDTTLADLKWEVPFSGATTINSVNRTMTTKYYFPMVSYGVFQKKPYESDEVGNSYTEKSVMDKYNRWWIDSFYPSLNATEVLKKAFESKNYVIGGSALSDPIISNIYMSTNLADGQAPVYNLGNPMLGSVNISASFSNNPSDVGYQQELDFPYFYVAGKATLDGQEEDYNFTVVDIYRPLKDGTVTVNSKTYMFDPGEHIVVIPADGWYKVELSANTVLNTTGTITAAQWWTDGHESEIHYENVEDMPVGLYEITPVEIQIVRNYDDNVELIKGKHNTRYLFGNPMIEHTGNTINWMTCYPHEDPYNQVLPSKKNDLTFKNSKVSSRRTSENSFGASYGSNTVAGTRGDSFGASGGYTSGSGSETSSPRKPFGRDRDYSYLNYGYIYQDEELSDGAQGATMAFDQAVTEGFICGISSLSSGITAVMKNGYSWSKSNGALNESFYGSMNYDHFYRESGTGEVVVESIDYPFNYNDYINAPTNRCKMTNDTLEGHVSCMVWLNRNDIIEPLIIHRGYEKENGSSVVYQTTTQLNMKITAFSTASRQDIAAKHDASHPNNPRNRYDAPTEFPVDLNLFNFTNKETKVVDWINNFTKAYNLELIESENSVEVNVNRGVKKTIDYAVNVDNRVNSDEATSEYISYPREMSVQYKVDIDEYGFELTVPAEHINDDDWYKYGDSGFTIINLSDDSYETSTQNTQTNFSYTWYCPFTWKEVNWNSTSGFVENGNSATTIMPVIEKSEYMAEGYGYDEAMKHDGYSFTQRFWFRQTPSSQFVTLADNNHEKVYLSYPTNSYDGFHLSYKDTEKSIVSEYFNISPMLSSNYVNIDVHLTPNEYISLKGGAMVKFESDLYYISEISGYDPSGKNTASLKLIKKP
jgi:hypothetical protein